MQMSIITCDFIIVDFNETTETKTLETQNDSSIDGNISEPNKVTDSTNQTTLPPGILKKPNSEKKGMLN